MDLFEINHLQFKDILQYNQLRIQKDQITFICGKSGCGKSTLLKLLNAAVSPSSGEIFYQGKPLSSYDTIALRRDVILVSQNVFLFQDTIENNFISFYKYRNQTPPSPQQMRSFLQLCAGNFPLDTLCNNLSGGERQRVFIAICLSFMPTVLLLDEPTSALDEHTAHQLMTQLKSYSLQHHISLVIVTHHQGLAQTYGDTIIQLDWEGN